MKKLWIVSLLLVLLVLVGCTQTGEPTKIAEKSGKGAEKPTPEVTPPVTGQPSTEVTPTAPTEGMGTLTLQITDAQKTYNVTSLLLIVTKVEVHRAAAGEVCKEVTEDNETTEECIEPADGMKWETFVGTPQSYDLIQIKGIKELLGSKDLEPGKYTQIRLVVEGSSIFIDGVQKKLIIPSKEVKLVKSFDLNEGESTTLTLDFDVDKSIVSTGTSFIMRPVIKVIQE